MAAYLNTVEHYSGARPVYGLQSPALLGLEEGTTIEEIAAHHVKTIRSLQPCGPYHLVGYCLGGLLAFETARQLHAQNAELGLVGVIQFDVHDMPFAPFKCLRIESIHQLLKNLFPAFAEFFTIGKYERNAAIIRLLYRFLRMPPDTGDLFPPWTAERRLYDTHETAWRTYIPTAFPGVVTLFRPHRLPVAQPDPKLGWGTIRGQRLEVRTLPGSGIHGDCINCRNGKTTANAIERAIEAQELAARRCNAPVENASVFDALPKTVH